MKLFKSKTTKHIFEPYSVVVTQEQMHCHLQEIEDRSWNSFINQEASRLFSEWQNAKIVDINGKKFRNWIMVIKPFGRTYTIYNDDCAQYKGAYATRDEINNRLNKLIKEHENKQ